MSAVGGVTVREAVEEDVLGILEIFREVYGEEYPYARFRDPTWLKRSVYTDDILMLVAVDDATDTVLGTASVVLDVGAHTDLIGEMGRLAVRSSARGRGVGGALMEGRVAQIESRLHVAIVENRTVHPWSQQISESHGFVCVGFLPMKHLFQQRESIALFVRHFGAALELRDNHPRIVPEVHDLAYLALERTGVGYDAIVDEDSAAYPHDDGFEVEELSEAGLPALLRIERGRVRSRDVFGPMRLQYGFFKLSAKHATYLVARRGSAGDDSGAIAAAIGYIRDDIEHTVRVFELIACDDDAIRFLFSALLSRAEREWGVFYIEADLSAHAPRLQRTLIELGFLPVAYVPAMVFHDVERLDVVRMVRLFGQPSLGDLGLIDSSRVVADLVSRAFIRQAVLPEVADAVHGLSLFTGLNEEQATRVAGTCAVVTLRRGEILFAEGQEPEALTILLDGEAAVMVDGAEVGRVCTGELIGELSLLTGERHSATVHIERAVTAATLSRKVFSELMRQRPDIGVVVYRNLAVSLGRKLQRLDASMSVRPTDGSTHEA